MAYCSKSDIEKSPMNESIVLQLVDDEQTGAHTDTTLARITECIVDADSRIDSHIRARYSVPLDATVPAFIKRISKTLTCFYLYQRRAQNFETPQWLIDSMTLVESDLKALRKGEIDLGVEPPPAVSDLSMSNNDGPDRLFTSDTLEKF